MSKYSTPVFVLVAVIAVIAGVWLGQETNHEPVLKPPVIQGAIYPQAKVLNDFEITNHLSQRLTKDDFKNHWSLFFVGYTHCPDICPTTMAVMTQVSEYMREQEMPPPQIVFLSIDPKRDTVQLLKQYVEYFDKDFVGLTGTEAQVQALSIQLNAVYRKAPGSSGKMTEDDYLMDHSSALMLLNPDGNLQSILTAPHLPGIIIESIIQSQAYYDVLKESAGS